MYQLSLPRITRITLLIGAVGTIATGLLWGVSTGGAFLVGAMLSLITIRSWVQFAAMLTNPDPGARKPGAASGMFLVLRYLLFAGIVYVMMKYLESPPAAILAGLLASFAAVVLDFLSGSFGNKAPSK
ncbi:MAG: ATP synthase subunit I [Bryobacteraceae bacterium]